MSLKLIICAYQSPSSKDLNVALVHDKNLVKLKRAAALSRQNALAEDISGNTDAALVSVLAAD